MAIDQQDREISELRRAVCEYPGRLALRLQLAAQLFKDYKKDEAKNLLQEGLLYLGNDSQSHLLIAVAMAEFEALPDAISCLQSAARFNPSDGQIYAALAENWARLGELEKAAGFVLKAEGLGVACDLSAYSDGPTNEMTRHLFDQYAEKFDAHLGDLSYRVPLELSRLLEPALDRQKNLSVIDLGCGTGLMAQYLRPHSKHLVGIDLSPNMLSKAAKLNQYDELHTGDIVAYLTNSLQQFDLIVAADVLVYLSDLDPLFQIIEKRLMSGGLFAASIEYTEYVSYQLNEARRFSHNPDYIKQRAEAGGIIIEDNGKNCAAH